MRDWRWWVLAALVFAVFAEATTRFEDWISNGTPFLSPYTSQNDLVIRDADGVHGRRNATFGKWRMNNLGMRGPDADSVAAPGAVRVVAAGASETFGVYEAPGLEFPRQLEDSLDAARESGRCSVDRFEVLNSAFRGMSLPTVAQDLRNRVRRFGPDVVVYYPTPTQYLEPRVPTAARPDSTADAGAPGIAARIDPRFADNFVRSLREMVPESFRNTLRSLRRGPGEVRFETLPEDRLAAYEDGLRELVGTVRGIGAEVVLATHANAFATDEEWNEVWLEAWETVLPGVPREVILAFDSAAAAATARVAGDSGAVLVDVRSVMSTDVAESFGDFSHFTDEGSGRVAAALRDGVVEVLGRREGAVCR